MNSFAYKPRLAVAWFAIFLVGILAGVLGYYEALRLKYDDLLRAARGRSLVLSVPEVAKLTGTPADEGTPAFEVVRQRLLATRAVSTSIYQAYLLRYDPKTGQAVCLAASEPDGSDNFLPPGKILPITLDTAGTQAVLRRGEVVVKKLLVNDHGRWVAAYAGIGGGSGNEFLRLEVSRRSWYMALLNGALSHALYAWLLCGVPLAIYMIAKRDSMKTRFIDMLSAAIEQSATAVLIMDQNGVIRYVNQSLCALSKFTREELIGNDGLTTTAGLPPEQMERFANAYKAGKSVSAVMEVPGKAGHKYNAFVTTTPVFDRNGNKIAGCSVVVDVSELNRQASVLREAKEKAEASDKAKSVFMATMSHEVRTPLNGICGFTDLLFETALSGEQREYAQAIRDSSNVLLRLVSDIMDFSKLEAGRMRISPDSTNLRALIKDVIATMRDVADAKGVRLTSEVAAGVPELVLADKVRLRQVLVNLVGNAVKFTPEGEVDVSVRVHEGPPDAGKVADALYIEFAVRDTGIGIASEDQPHIFKPFVQLDSATSRHYEGAGLGLVISYDLVRLMGGSISVASAKGKGSVFTFYIKCARYAQALKTHPINNMETIKPRS